MPLRHALVEGIDLWRYCILAPTTVPQTSTQPLDFPELRPNLVEGQGVASKRPLSEGHYD